MSRFLTATTCLVAVFATGLPAVQGYCYENCTSNHQCAQSDPTTCKTCAPYNDIFKCQPVTTWCGTRCAGPDDCESGPYGICTVCNATGFCVKPPDTCGKKCASSTECNGLKCQACLDGVCTNEPSMCNATCTTKPDCFSSDPSQECFMCENGSCIAPECGTTCAGDEDCGGKKIGECTFCLEGKCSLGKTCGETCDPDKRQCTGDCFLCLEDKAANNYVCSKPPPPTKRGCGDYCGSHGYGCPQQQGDCTYCQDNSCTTYEEAMKIQAAKAKRAAE